ncbi:MAG: glycoside hydrolase family 99-like domain-containing protein [Lachnospiraceae bacterium]|nr:glycoside hydrolase family 99-like domain-containing protein [Lachnospiraceae bacterium]
MNTKIIALYLPQFHRVKENDEWWGEGFTEWTAVKKAEPLFDGHDQPRVPKDNYYYDLLDKRTMEWQASLMHEYGVDGLCFYHYWFKDGRQILEKPAENLLEWKDIDMPFCFSWANETWKRSWSNIEDGNAWIEDHEAGVIKEGSGILLQQEYGTEEDWKKHFYYLLPFFMDKRYIRIDDKPVFMIYKPEDIGCLKSMRDYWNKLSQENGLSGIMIIGAVREQSGNDNPDGYYQRVPGEFEHCICGEPDGLKLFSYDKTWKKILEFNGGKNYFYTALTGFDDSPRRGRKGNVFLGFSPEKFERYLTSLLKKSEEEGKELIFINAWNEWGEGMYLEPDQKNGYNMLEAVRNARKNSENGENPGEKTDNASDQAAKEELFIYGAGCFGQKAIEIINKCYPGTVIKGVVDSYKTGEVSGYKIFDPDEVKDFDTPIVIALIDFRTAASVYRSLSEKGYKNIRWFNGEKEICGESFLVEQCRDCSSWKRGAILQVEMHIMDSCNLNCRGCSHFSPIFEDELPDFEARIEDVKALAGKFGYIHEFYILGGEPFLNPRIGEYAREIRKILPESDIYIVTNGLLIPKIIDDTFKMIRDSKVKISISEYKPVHERIASIIEKLELLEVDYEIRPVFDKLHFNKPLTTSPKTIHENLCISYPCVTIWNGMISRCPTLMYISKFNEYFKQNLPNDGILRLSDEMSGWDLIDYFEKEVPLCRYCIKNEIEWGSCGKHPGLDDFAATD